jgi:hypothetical protein
LQFIIKKQNPVSKIHEVEKISLLEKCGAAPMMPVKHRQNVESKAKAVAQIKRDIC